MAGGGVILASVLAALLVMAVGAVARRRGLLTSASADVMARLVADVTLPALCFRSLAGMGRASLARGWFVPLLGFNCLGVAALVGVAVARAVTRDPVQRRTVAFLIAIGNWIFLPLPIAEALYGGGGTATVLLNNVGAQIFLWTFGASMIERGGGGLARNAGLWATLAGVAIALGDVSPARATERGGIMAASVLTALEWVGSLTVPLSALTTGAQLVRADGAALEGAEPARAAHASGSGGHAELVAVVAARLILAPLAFVAFLAALSWFGIGARAALDPAARSTEILVAAMPVSLTAGALVARAGADVRLASRAILASTLASAVTLPLLHIALARGG